MLQLAHDILIVARCLAIAGDSRSSLSGPDLTVCRLGLASCHTEPAYSRCRTEEKNLYRCSGFLERDYCDMIRDQQPSKKQIWPAAQEVVKSIAIFYKWFESLEFSGTHDRAGPNLAGSAPHLCEAHDISRVIRKKCDLILKKLLHKAFIRGSCDRCSDWIRPALEVRLGARPRPVGL